MSPTKVTAIAFRCSLVTALAFCLFAPAGQVSSADIHARDPKQEASVGIHNRGTANGRRTLQYNNTQARRTASDSIP